MFCTDKTVLSHSEVSCSNNSFINLRAGSIGTEVNSAETSYKHRHSPGKRVTLLVLLTKVFRTLYVVGRLTYQQARYLGKDFCHSISD